MAESATIERDQSRPPELERAATMAHLLDESLQVPGTTFRIGLDPILGIIPYAGDGVASIGSLYIVLVGYRLGVPARTLATMLAYVALDFSLGSVPLVGVFIDATLKANRHNVSLIDAHMRS